MKNLITISLSLVVGFMIAVLVLEPRQVAIGGPAQFCSAKNGDVNADGNLDLSDAVVILGNLFLGDPTVLPPLCTGSGGGLPATGQAVCYAFDNLQLWVEAPCDEVACVGQDGSYERGCPTENRFVDHRDGTITDTCTGLMWQQEPADIDPTFADTVVWCDAMSYCERLSFAGYDDWRLPNVRELQSIVDYGRDEPANDPIFTGLAQFFWSSTTFKNTLFDAWGVGFNNGYVGIRPKEGDVEFSFNYVRAVRDAR